MNRRGFFATVFGALAAGLSRPRYREDLSAVETVRRAFGFPSGYGCIAPGTMVSAEHMYSSTEMSLFNADGTLCDEAYERVQVEHQWARRELAERIDAALPMYDAGAQT